MNQLDTYPPLDEGSTFSKFLYIEQLFHKNLNAKDKESMCENVLLTSYVCKERPLLNHLFKAKVPCTIIKEPRGKGKGRDPVQEFKHCRFIIPLNRIGFGCFHPKIMFIRFENSLRLVISSANLYEVDWAQLGQVIWFQDFPRNVDDNAQENDTLEVLESFLESCVDEDSKEMLMDLSTKQYQEFECPTNIEDIKITHFVRGGLNLSDYDFNSCSVRFIPSINGQIKSDEKEKYGLYRFADLISQNESVNIKDTSKIIYQCTSYGNLKKEYLDKYVDTLTGMIDTDGLSLPEVTERPELKLIYPTQDYVDKIKEKNKREVNCLKMNEKKWVNNPEYPKEMFYKFDVLDQYKPDHDLNPHHTKAIVITDGESDDIKPICIYIGSHNMSAGAWGTRTVTQESDDVQMTNYEFGVVFFPDEDGTLDRVYNSFMHSCTPEKYSEDDMPYIIQHKLRKSQIEKSKKQEQEEAKQTEAC
ncbi:unnamed protein product [Moneuplotes crassus]|uniref:Uncharacterized protein n=1 Tax=Euplotes crassus TaxID=5936 RepID=A0AAD1UDU7_EUPCR|nr:unnamed protein product [Moneuplotes crassus]